MAQERNERPSAVPPAPVDDDSPFYTISQVAQMLGIQPAALRRLDEQDIVRPGRSDGGQRRYSRHEVERLREVLQLTDGGITLPGVREVLALRQQVSDLQDEVNELRERDRRRSESAGD
jgi:MerR family transcriptional regulator/heat shock protein HspR